MHNFVDLAVRRRVSVVMAALAVIAFGGNGDAAMKDIGA